MGDKIIAHPCQQRRIFGEALHQNLFGTFEGGFHVRHHRVLFFRFKRLGSQEFLRFDFRREQRIGEQRVSKRFQPRLARDHRFGAALLLVRQVQILQRGFVFRRRDLRLQFIGKLALRGNIVQNRAATFFQFAQITQPLVEQAQLNIVEPTGGFFAIARDERYRSALIEQCDGGGNLRRFGGEFSGEADLN